MACVNASWHCQSDVFIERCSSSEEQAFAEGEPALGEDVRRAQ